MLTVGIYRTHLYIIMPSAACQSTRPRFSRRGLPRQKPANIGNSRRTYAHGGTIGRKNTRQATKWGKNLLPPCRCVYICIIKTSRKQGGHPEKGSGEAGASSVAALPKAKPTAASVRLGYSSITKRKTETVMPLNGVPICVPLRT